MKKWAGLTANKLTGSLVTLLFYFCFFNVLIGCISKLTVIHLV